MSGDQQTGTVSIALIIDVPVDEAWRRNNRGDTMRKSISIGDWTCTQAEAVKIAAKFRELNPELTTKAQIIWTGPNQL